MARSKTYDRDDVVQRAMLAFWRRGFEGLGVREIGREAGINRFALQNEFGGKQGLFLEALRAYLGMSAETVLKPLEDGGLDAIIIFFRALTKGTDDDPRNAGCLMVNTAIENASLGMEAVQELTVTHYAGMQTSFERALRKASDSGEIAEDFDIEGGALMLLTYAMGLEVFVRMKGGMTAASVQCDFFIAEIERWRIRRRPSAHDLSLEGCVEG